MAEKIWQEQIRLEPGDQGLKLVNPTPFFVILPEVVVGKKTLLAEDEALTLRPKGEVILPGVKPKAQKIVLKYINDYGAYQPLNYSCT
ncbi:hypothetical protein SJ301_29780, partial [Klebsiella pneumoniae]|nr:hypothetical protein [Klebsiella pneumoniae]